MGSKATTALLASMIAMHGIDFEGNTIPRRNKKQRAPHKRHQGKRERERRMRKAREAK